MMHLSDLAGTLQHQTILQAICDLYAPDRRVRAVIVFGSLGRGNWDIHSDIDLDVVLANGVELDVKAELERLGDATARVGETPALLIPDQTDAGEIVFESLMQLSVRYHPLAATSPNIVESMHLLVGDLDAEEIVAAAEANQPPDPTPLQILLDEVLRYVVVADVTLQRGRGWLAVELLHRIRAALMVIFTRAYQGQRSFYFFEEHAAPQLQAKLGSTLSTFDLAAMRQGLLRVIDLLETDLGELANDSLALRPTDRKLLAAVRSRLER